MSTQYLWTKLSASKALPSQCLLSVELAHTVAVCSKPTFYHDISISISTSTRTYIMCNILYIHTYMYIYKCSFPLFSGDTEDWTQGFTSAMWAPRCFSPCPRKKPFLLWLMYHNTGDWSSGLTYARPGTLFGHMSIRNLHESNQYRPEQNDQS